MKQERYCIYNQTQHNFLSQGLSAVDTTTEPFRALIADLTDHAAEGLWLRPFRGIPETRNLPRFDLVYLDDRERVIKGAESFSAKEFAPFSGRVASAIVLPPHTITDTHTHAGDQLKIAVAHDAEMERLLAGGCEAGDTGLAEAAESAAGAPSIAEEAQETDSEYPRLSIEAEHSVFARFFHWLFPEDQKTSDRRKAERMFSPGLIAYYWNGASPESYALRDISLNGFYLLTDERWRADTIIQMRLQRTDLDQSDREDSIPVMAKVVRWGVDGVGLSTVFAGAPSEHAAVLNGAGTAAQEWVAFMRRLYGVTKKDVVQVC